MIGRFCNWTGFGPGVWALYCVVLGGLMIVSGAPFTSLPGFWNLTLGMACCFSGLGVMLLAVMFGKESDRRWREQDET